MDWCLFIHLSQIKESINQARVANGISKADERWRDYPKKDWEHDIPKAKKQLIGRETQWKKGESGRKL